VWLYPPLVPDEREQHAVPGHVRGGVNEPVRSGRVRSGGVWPGPNMAERLLSGFLAEGHYQGVPYRPPELPSWAGSLSA
jgi:hypothetical protein